MSEAISKKELNDLAKCVAKFADDNNIQLTGRDYIDVRIYARGSQPERKVQVWYCPETPTGQSD